MKFPDSVIKYNKKGFYYGIQSKIAENKQTY